MNITVNRLRSVSNEELARDLAHTSKTKDHYPKSYLSLVKKEIERREKRRSK